MNANFDTEPQLRSINNWALVAILGFHSLYLATAIGGTIADAPLFMEQAVVPNMIMVLDDSGSMDQEALLPTNDGALWWNTTRQSFVGLNSDDVYTAAQASAGLLNFNNTSDQSSGTWKKYVYLFPNGTGTGNRQYADATNDHFAVPPLPKYAFMRSPTYNKAYFDPAATYEPWKSYGTTYTNITSASAPSDPALGTYRFDLATEIASYSSNLTFKLQQGMVIPKDTYYRKTSDTSWKTATADVAIDAAKAGDYGIRYFPATFYLPKTDSLPEDFGFTGTRLVGYAPNGTTELWGYEIKPANFASTAAYNAAMQNFANWFSYYRKRHLAARGSIGAAFEEIAKVRVGSFKINSLAAVTMRDMSSTTDRNAFFSDLYTNYVGSGGTPNRQAMKYAGDQFMRTNTGAPIQYACQRNAAVLLTDGFALADTSSGVGNADGTSGVPYADTVSNTMADIAMYFYKTNLRSTLTPGQVRIKKACLDATPDPRLDCNKNLHMNTYAVTVGTRGILFNPDAEPPQDAYDSHPSWPTTFPDRHPSAVDDLWHATVNGRGKLLNASRPAEIADRLRSILQDFIEKEGSAAAAAANSTRVDTDKQVFQATFNSADWTGQLLAYQLDNDGVMLDRDANGVIEDADALWEAGTKIPVASERLIYTYDPAISAGISFQWSSLSSGQKAQLISEDVVNYLRGDQTSEEPSGTYRKRNSLLGDIVNSDPAFVGPETFGYQTLASEGASYDTFLSTTKRDRIRMLYVGANDGMLHGFRVCAPTDGVCAGTVSSNDGKEVFAFVPNTAIYSDLKSLSDPGYNHRYFVDGAAKAGDAYIGGSWATVLVGSTGAGGRAVFALDVTDPAGFSASDVLWEFTNNSDGDLGYTLPQATIVRLYDGHWGALVANGYNSNSGRAVLFILNLQTGAVLKKIDTGAGGNTVVAKNGLSAPLAVDVPRDVDGDGTEDPADKIVDYIYAGDLVGNVWKFDVTATSSAGWKLATGGAPMFVACTTSATPCTDANRQPITAKAVAIKATADHQTGGLMVLMGTGRYFEDGDNLVPADPQLQSLYGLWDSGLAISGRGQLQAQTIVAEVTVGARDLRVTSQNAVDYTTQKGWYLDLKTSAGTKQGERVISSPMLDGKRVAFVTMLPIADPCSSGGTSWIMDLSALTGQQAARPVWDVAGSGGTTPDGKFDAYDKVTVSGALKAPSGLKSTIGIIKTPAVVSIGGKKKWFFSGSSGGMAAEQKGTDEETGRQSWVELH